MREFKFRAWDTKHKKMFYSDYHNENDNRYRFNFDENGRLVFEVYDFSVIDGLVYERWVTLDNIMQYTGLNDVKGKEIYEGDIISIVDSIGTHICEVKFSNGCFVSVEIGDDYEVCLREDIGNFPHTVIGNIYENKEIYYGLYRTYY